MTQDVLGLIMDGLLLCFLGVAAYFAAKLSRQLQVFRKSRAELEKLVSDLTGSIAQAERSIDGLRRAAQKAGLDLQDEINDARGLLDELQIIVEAGEGIAARLEKNTARPRRHNRSDPVYRNDPVRPRFDDDDDADNAPAARTPVRPSPPPRPESDGSGMFTIRDPEFEGGMMDGDDLDDEADDMFATGYDDDSADDLPGFLTGGASGHNDMSKAERELYQALHGGRNRRKRTSAGGV